MQQTVSSQCSDTGIQPFHNIYYVIFDTNKTISQPFKQQLVEPPD
ncbi:MULTISPECIES: hypothetical protein [unclassified Wolbachia]|nr:hypothetical protein [Wolbachia endosymbiont (group A) of Apoderus coryli]